MRTPVFTDEASIKLDAQIDYLIARHAERAAKTLSTRVDQFLNRTLCNYPATGKFLENQNLWESWIPGTRLVLWYQFDDDVLTIISVCNTSEGRPTNS
jgi:plasmid stabilization system protein ParE